MSRQKGAAQSSGVRLHIPGKLPETQSAPENLVNPGKYSVAPFAVCRSISDSVKLFGID